MSLSNRIKVGDKEYIKLDLLPIYQKGQVFFLSKINAKELLHIYTVRPAKYDLKKHTSQYHTYSDDQEYYEHLIQLDKKKINDKDFQRDENPNRVNKIAKFLENEEHPFFPNTIIATCDLANDNEMVHLENNTDLDEAILSTVNEHDYESFLFEQNQKYTICIPYLEDSILIIDGQHRLKGLEKASAKIQENYELILSLIVGFDRSVVAQLFYTINYEHKSVNKSLLYHLTGEFSSELDDLTFMHYVVKVLNEIPESPFFEKIKMLGVNPKNATIVQKRKLTISQAFLIDYLIKTISRSSVRSIYQPIFLYYYENEHIQIEIIRFIIKYFNAVKSLKRKDWEDASYSVLSKGLGVAALIRVMHLLFVKLFIDEWDQNPENIKRVNVEHLTIKLDGLQNVDFTREGIYAGSASGGSINKLTQEIVEKIDFFDNDDYSTFLEKYKSNYLETFKDWIVKK